MTWNPNWQQDPRYSGYEQTGTTTAQSTSAIGPSMASTTPGTVQQPRYGSVTSESATAESAMQYVPPAVPLVDIVDSPDELVVYVDTPGFEEKHLEIHADGNTLHVSGDRHEEPVGDTSDEQLVLSERPLRVERTIPLPMQIDPEQVVAKHENGVCNIIIPKDEQNQRHEIGFQ
ncbi:Molecular chaperone (HSP20 family) [Halanaeroarchaeum sp. HSR-CO]|uniref:Hsp20/alpha crystallin family protein n=1 Tax=Halanaeroarchaeum sp. HSR-CO TaxID=2866382 RepID=UPI00217CCB11|nr:Hsp20/alpha crystallin family protein [Halanaeroarchaeum sp. HSR-CO]UWG46991.1 Molecular chaperone (HSP20 family) [Halanaeroarchaeum sp. HSR-CO]